MRKEAMRKEVWLESRAKTWVMTNSPISSYQFLLLAHYFTCPVTLNLLIIEEELSCTKQKYNPPSWALKGSAQSFLPSEQQKHYKKQQTERESESFECCLHYWPKVAHWPSSFYIFPSCFEYFSYLVSSLSHGTPFTASSTTWSEFTLNP